MKTKYQQDFLLGAITGVIVYGLNLLFLELPYYPALENASIEIMSVLLVLGIVFEIVILLRKKPSTASVLVRFFTMFMTFWCLLLLIGTLQILPMLHQWLQIQDYSFKDNLSGLSSLIFLAIIFLVSLTETLGRVIYNAASKHKA